MDCQECRVADRQRLVDVCVWVQVVLDVAGPGLDAVFAGPAHAAGPDGPALP